MGIAHKFEFGRRDIDEDANRQTASLFGLAIALLLVVVGLHVIHVLHNASVLEDCMMSGQAACTK